MFSVYSGYVSNTSTLYSTILVLRPHLQNKQGALTGYCRCCYDNRTVWDKNSPVLLHCAKYKSHPAGISLKLIAPSPTWGLGPCFPMLLGAQVL